MPSLALAVKLGAKSAPFVAPFLGDKRSFAKTGSGQPKEIGPKDDCHRHRAEGRARGAADEAAQERAGKSCPLSKLYSACLVNSSSLSSSMVGCCTYVHAGLWHNVAAQHRALGTSSTSTPRHFHTMKCYNSTPLSLPRHAQDSHPH